jgi:hypothetical protein
MEWEPPGPPSYQSLSFDNPGYGSGEAIESQKNHTKSVYAAENELIIEKVPTSTLATPDPSKRPENMQQVESLAQNSVRENGTEMDGATPSTSTESLASMSTKDPSADSYPSDGVDKKSTTAKEGLIEELNPPPFNPNFYLAEKGQEK